MSDVVLVTSSFLPRFGGVEEHVLNVARSLRDAGTDVVVWSVDRGDDVPSEVDGIPVRYLPTPLPARSVRSAASFVLRAPGAALAWRRALRADRPRVVHVHCYGPNGVWASALARLARRPLVVTTHGETFGDADGVFETSALLRSSLRSSLRSAAAVTACSRYAADDLARFGAEVEDVRVVPNGIDVHEPEGAPPAGLPERYVLGIGRLVGNKGMDLLLEAFTTAALPEDVHVVVAGDGPVRGDLEAAAQELGIADRVVFTGRLDRPEVVATMSRAAALVVPSRAEAFGIAVLEGWRAGVPVVATNRGGPPEFVSDGVDGLLVDPTDVPALAAALRRAVLDEGFARRLGAAGRVRAADYGWARVADEYRDVYRGTARHP